MSPSPLLTEKTLRMFTKYVTHPSEWKNGTKKEPSGFVSELCNDFIRQCATPSAEALLQVSRT